ncbi:MAG TPA: D-2-hydroxyacid dehydrogenase [Candidatus Caccousia avistercoris]|nr:D-2-hydroxyacid dehydrogenase [Candidatus Caccousia avistercoris]
MRIVILDGYTENPGDLSWGGFEALGQVTVYDRTPSADGGAEIVRRAKGAEILIVNKTPLSASTLQALAPELRYIGVLATGYNVVDTAAAKAQGVPVCNIPTYGTTAVAQFVMALLLELCHHVGDHSRSVKEGGWSRCPDFCYWNTPLIELAGKTFGVIGYGRIGKAAAKLAAAFGMNVLAFDKFAQEDGGTARLVTLDELLAQSDVISLHCPLFPDTQGIVNKDTIAKMKDGVLLINTSRGPLIVEEDLAVALRSGKVAGAGLDVLAVEPASPDNPLLQEENCLITPHIAWAPKESRQRLMDIAVENLKAFLAGTPQNVVNS